MARKTKKQKHSTSMSDALSRHRSRTKAIKEALEIDAEVGSDSEVDNGLSAFDEWENLVIELSDDSEGIKIQEPKRFHAKKIYSGIIKIICCV